MPLANDRNRPDRLSRRFLLVGERMPRHLCGRVLEYPAVGRQHVHGPRAAEYSQPAGRAERRSPGESARCRWGDDLETAWWWLPCSE